MITIGELQQRALDGPVLREKDFDLKMAYATRQLVKDYEIVHPPEEIIPDPAIGDRIFRAGVDLLLEVGLYHLDLQRGIRVSRDEIYETMATRPQKVEFGDGRDTITLVARGLESSVLPIICPGPSGTPMGEDMYVPIMQSHAQEVTAGGVFSGALLSANGIPNKVGSPSESACLIAEATWLREIARRVGKPDMFIGLPMSGVSPAAVMSSYFPEGYTKRNSQMPIHIFPELKLNWDRLTLAHYALQFGVVPWNSYGAVLGAFAGKPEEAAVISVAGQIGELLYGRGSISSLYCFDIKGRCTTKKAVMATTAVDAAMRKYIPFWNKGGAAAGPCTEMALYELAVQGIAYTVSGAAGFWGTPACRGAQLNHSTGMEGRMLGETAWAATRLTRCKANEILNKLYEKFESEFADPPKGKSFGECYDTRTVRPSQEYLDLFALAKSQIAALGVDYSY